MLRLSISAWDKKEYDQERRLKKALKDLAILKITCVNGKFLELQYIKTQVQNITDDSSFQNFKFNYVERAKITICNNAVIWTDKVIGCVKSRFEDGSHKDILQAACKALNSWTVMEETPKENTTGFGCETGHVEENGDNGNDEQSDDVHKQSDDENGKHCDNNNKNDVNSAENSFCFTEVDSSTYLLTKQFEHLLLINRRSNFLIEDGIKDSPRLCQKNPAKPKTIIIPNENVDGKPPKL